MGKTTAIVLKHIVPLYFKTGANKFHTAKLCFFAPLVSATPKSLLQFRLLYSRRKWSSKNLQHSC